MKNFTIAALLILSCPLSLHAEGKITYSGIPCQWSCTHKVSDTVGLKPDDPATAREDREIIARAGWVKKPYIVEREDERLLLIFPRRGAQ